MLLLIYCGSLWLGNKACSVLFWIHQLWWRRRLVKPQNTKKRTALWICCWFNDSKARRYRTFLRTLVSLPKTLNGFPWHFWEVSTWLGTPKLLEIFHGFVFVSTYCVSLSPSLPSSSCAFPVSLCPYRDRRCFPFIISWRRTNLFSAATHLSGEAYIYHHLNQQLHGKPAGLPFNLVYRRSLQRY